MKSKFKIKELDCSNCAVKLERTIKKIDGVVSVSINFMTQKMELEYDETRKEEIMQNVINVIKKVESEVTIEEV